MVLHFFKSGYEKLKSALSRARAAFGKKIASLFQKKMDAELWDQLEEMLYEADFGVKTAAELTEKIKELHRKNPSFESADYLSALKMHLIDLLKSVSYEPVSIGTAPCVILIVGVNGNGKTTSVAKLAHYFKKEGSKPLVAAADTFRAAAIEQLEIWALKTGVDIVKGAPKADPSAVVFDAIQAAKARGAGIVLIDTAGRLHTKIPLMQELEKVKRTCNKVLPGAPHETWLVLDATTGQNAIDQAKTFHQFVPLTGIILTKLDGTAKGGIVLAIQREVGVPVRFVGTGEGMEDLQIFDPEAFVRGLFDE